ncbi:ABC-type cobalamin/Fe3+-siderophores transport system ATPase subunit [Winogradskyella wandonensis]|uniref:ABC-type cobalamin/Fe3+-siderophores transport system ATPase subunit n=1 Tax=Winogradskyella wandonensis TaxID=1442586 RepID=A0A4V6NEN9_9FLAO|nr:ATP-binding cassette domain-containing protein [Winogradskyella wandonensis]TCK68691.1 ABC-type cobalamin/Fe3+-siderophores transport system ATPase subunit [Winogradskyella wandonensis]
MIFELDNVELYFKNKRILNGIYLKAETGKVTGILGSNGCGKSSLLDIAFGNLKPKYKLIRIDKTPILKPLYLTKLVKYLPQYDFMPGSFKLCKLFDLFEVNWDVFAKDFEEFAPFKMRKISQLSGGERRCIEIYIILKSKSEIIFLDEPFNGIAPIIIERIKALITEIKKNKIVILTDHKYQDVIDMADDIYLLKNGTTKFIKKLSELEDYGYLSEGQLH